MQINKYQMKIVQNILLHVVCMYLEILIIFYISVHVLVYKICHESAKQKFWI
jgi:hypothetical protein